MKILLHVCCGPCTMYPLDFLRQQGHEVSGWFHNPNIHPYREFRRRIEALEEFARQKNFNVEIDYTYGLRAFLRQVVFHEDSRCGLCYDLRLTPTAKRAAIQGVDAFSSTLLYSKYQNHSLLKNKGEALAKQHGIGFYYHDFREGWQQGIDASVAMNLYRQPYCGCIYSEQERYDKKMPRKVAPDEASQ
ncbi:epoxyqueuosine reductase QueH [Desulfobulbus sp. F5]|nr:epoxyqueuosine reductase QueH [Desulfobulbus sp. F5]